jgi:hypothetical protein
VLAALSAALAAPARAAIIVDSDDPRCATLAGSFPPGLDWIDAGAGLALVTSFEPAVAVPVDLESEPPELAAPGPFSDLRSAIAVAACGGSRDPLFDGITAPSPDLAFVTASSCESVAFVDPATGKLRSLSVGVPMGLGITFPFNPAPGASQSRVAISTRACVTPPASALDSRGDPVAVGCRTGEPSYYTSFTSGAARVGDRLFVSTSNLGAGAGTADPQFLPGTVLVFELGAGGATPAIAPHATTPVLFTSGFDPSHVTAYETPSGRALVLVGVSGALGLVPDDPRTPEREAGGTPKSDAAIDVIDAEQLRVIATIPLGPAALSFERLGIDRDGRLAVIGSAVARHLFAVDLAPLDALAPDAPWQLLDGSDGPDAVIFDAEAPLILPGIPGGAPPDTCPGYVVGAEFSDDGRFVYATDFCDGTLGVVEVLRSGSPGSPFPAQRFRALEPLPLVAPLRPESLSLPRTLGALRVREGRPGDDFEGPEVAFLVGQPEALLCGVTVPVPAPEPAGLPLGASALLVLRALAVRRGRRTRRARLVPDGGSSR